MQSGPTKASYIGKKVPFMPDWFLTTQPSEGGRCWFIIITVMPEDERYQHYEVLRREDGSLWELGRGAMGITYKAFDTNLRCAVALKVINSTYLQNDTARQRFLREARSAAALRHPNVASVFNLSTDQDNYFSVLQFIDAY